MRLHPSVILQQIVALRLAWPDLLEDELELSIESETDTHEFLRSVERIRQEAAHLAGAIAGNIAELEIRQGRFERREKAMRELIQKIMIAADIRKIELAEATLSIRKVPPKVIVSDEDSLPDIACKFVRKPDLAKIKELLTDSTGCCAGAVMSNGSETLSIRTK